MPPLPKFKGARFIPLPRTKHSCGFTSIFLILVSTINIVHIILEQIRKVVCAVVNVFPFTATCSNFGNKWTCGCAASFSELSQKVLSPASRQTADLYRGIYSAFDHVNVTGNLHTIFEDWGDAIAHRHMILCKPVKLDAQPNLTTAQALLLYMYTNAVAGRRSCRS